MKELQERDFDEKRRVLALWLYTLHSVDQSVVRQWLERETQSHLLMYLDTLTLAVDTFEVQTTKKIELDAIWSINQQKYVGRTTMQERLAQTKGAGTSDATKVMLEKVPKNTYEK